MPSAVKDGRAVIQGIIVVLDMYVKPLTLRVVGSFPILWISS
jgi:hypothetical protein